MTTGIGDRGRMRQAAALATVGGGVALGGLAVLMPAMAMVAALLTVGLAVAVAGVAPLLFVTFAGVFVSQRVGPAGLNMSVADVTLVASAFVALPFVPWRNVHVRRMAWAIGLYLALLFVTVVASPTQRAVLEWAHRASFLYGGLAVGAAIGHLGHGRRALRVLLGTAAVVSAAAILQSVGSGFVAAYPLGLNKNFAGALLAMCLLILAVAPPVLALRPRTLLAGRALLLLGLVATQSRGAIAGLFVALALWALIAEGRAVRAAVLLPAAALVGFAILLSIQAQAERSKSDFTPLNSRRISYDAAMREWRREPVFGSGLRYYKEPGYRFDVASYRDSYIEPHSVWYATLGESGVLGVVALVILLGATLRALRVASGPLALATGLVIITKLAHGLVDIYWIAGSQTLPWLMVGLAVAWREHHADAAGTAPVTAAAHADLAIR